MIARAQHPLYYHGFGMAVLNLETYMKVCGKSSGQLSKLQFASDCEACCQYEHVRIEFDLLTTDIF